MKTKTPTAAELEHDRAVREANRANKAARARRDKRRPPTTADLIARDNRIADLESMLVVETEAAGDARLALDDANTERAKLADELGRIAAELERKSTALDATSAELNVFRTETVAALRVLGLVFGGEPDARTALDKLVPISKNTVAEIARLTARVNELDRKLADAETLAARALAGKADAESDLAKTKVDLEVAEASCAKLIAEKHDLEQKTRSLELRASAFKQELDSANAALIHTLAAVHDLARATDPNPRSPVT